MKTTIHFAATCPSCCRPSASPFRAHGPDGKIVHGCVNEFHTGELVSPSASAGWHGRTEAKAIRRADKAGRFGGITRDAKHMPVSA